ncbi:uncharacterized protein LOC101849275 [Aplysia californica]|uniref:Uncharacterized protein LOC101849275 n=1 Tax=Aplysia californica TaxID=6500 RepID=A0ABM1W520_APLCA|nr:uncharacterized protein LOC101849275 [Aplysia californica]
MNLKKTKMFKVIATEGRENILKVSREYLRAGKDPNLRDPDTGGNLLHHIIAHSHKFQDPEMLTILYMLACRDVNVDAQDYNGDTALHCAVRTRGAYRIMVALIRCGTDTSITNSTGMTAEDILLQEKPVGHEEMLHWYCKFKPGLWCALREEKPNKRLIEKLLQSWCRLTTVKNGHVINMKVLIQHDMRKMSLLRLLETYENTVELALALIGGLGFIVRQWIKEGILTNISVNTLDLSHQQRYPDYPEAPQPLLAATWETNSFDAVDTLMDLNPDTSVLYACDKALTPKPLVFHLLDSMYRPKETRTVHRILEGADVSVRNSLGQTLLFQAIATEESLETVAILLRKGVNIGARDNLGRTARDFAENLQKPGYIKAIDEQVIQFVKKKDFPQIERLLLEGYDHLTDLKDSHGRSIVDIAKKFSSRQIYEVIRLGDAIQLYVKRVFRAVDEGNHDDLQKLVSCKKYAAGRDVCGRTPLLKAILQRRRGLVMKMVRDCRFTINLQDTMGRTPLHYAYLFLDDPDMIGLLHKNGANPDLEDVRGRRPISYSRSVCGVQTLSQLQRDVLDADLDIFTYKTNFEETFKIAVRAADLVTVKALVKGLGENGDITRYSQLLFDCVDLCREDIAVHLLNSGFRADIWKQYSKCEPTNPLCGMGECSHSMISLKQRAVETGCCRVVKLINQRSENVEALTRQSTSLLNFGAM